GSWVTFRVGAVEQRMRWIPPGRFQMGSPENEDERFDCGGPKHDVTLPRGFLLCDPPCPQGLWQGVMDTDPSRFKGQNRPVESVSWEDCQAFLDKLNGQLPGLALGLPTEAAWEDASR